MQKGYLMMSEAEAWMPDSKTRCEKGKRVRECISRYCREEEVVEKAKVEDVRGYWGYRC
jgi:hypothetical protein